LQSGRLDSGVWKPSAKAGAARPLFADDEISIIPLNNEFYISKSKKIVIRKDQILELRFLDSFRFMSSSLDSLASYLKEENLCTTKLFLGEPEKFQMVKRKGIFPYSYLNSAERLQDTQLPPYIC